MSILRALLLVLAVLYAAIAGLTALVGAFADGGDALSRLLLIVVHPLSASGLLFLLLASNPSRPMILGVGALLLVSMIGDLSAAVAIAGGAMKGDWWLPLIFTPVPIIGIVYAIRLASTGRSSDSP